MVDEFISGGFTYFDTAYLYHGGRSEEAIKEALIERYPRESFQLATKLPAWSDAATSAQAAKAMLQTSLDRTGAGYFDYYLLHNLGGPRTQSFDDYGIWDFVQQKKEEGVLRHVGLSLHDKAEVLDQLLTAHPEMEFVQLQINYADWESHINESRKCYEVARAHNKPIIVMEPIKGGSLVKLPERVSSVFGDNPTQSELAEWALRFGVSLDDIITILSGMSTIEQMRDNIEIMTDVKPLDHDEMALIEQARKALSDIPLIPCTDCRYCLKDCPEQIEIPSALESINILTMFEDKARAQLNYNWNTETGRASLCIQCGNCEMVCPQNIAIIDELQKSVNLFESDN